MAVVYLTASAVGSLVPTPGGLGAIEALMSAGLTAAGMHGAAAVSAVLLYRLLTFWLPVPIGWLALRYLERPITNICACQLACKVPDPP